MLKSRLRISGLQSSAGWVILSLAITTSVSHASMVVDLLAIETASPRSTDGGQDVNNDNRLRAYDVGSLAIDGFIKFDLSPIPDTATITGMTLTLFAEGAFSAPVNSPQIQIRRSNFDGWVRGGSGFPTAYDEILSSVNSGPFPAARHTAYSFNLDTTAVAWGGDLADDRLSLVLDEVSPSNNDYMYFFGSDPVTSIGEATSQGTITNYIPKLTVTYVVVPEPVSLGLLAVGGLAILRRLR